MKREPAFGESTKVFQMTTILTHKRTAKFLTSKETKKGMHWDCSGIAFNCTELVNDQTIGLGENLKTT